MKHKIGWPEHSSEVPISAFTSKSSVRPLRLTFHSESLQNLETGEAKALELLREFTSLSEIETVDTSSGKFPFIVLEPPDRKQDTLPFNVEYENKDQWCDSLVWGYRQYELMARASVSTEIDPEAQFANRLREILLAKAHSSLRHDLFITTSSYLIQQRTKSLFRNVNPMLPSEALKVVGLYLRFREEYVIEVFGNHGRHRYDRSLYYWVLMRHRLPAMWKYFSCCIDADPTKKDGAMGLGGSIMTRCVRALQARDEIGFQFYVEQTNTTRDIMLYHFDYLTLLLSGAFDAEARLARICYNIQKPKEFQTSFRKSQFRDALIDNNATDIHEVVSTPEGGALLSLLFELRNTIHGENLNSLAVASGGRPHESYVAIRPDSEKSFWDAIEKLGGPDQWGVTKKYATHLEPYSFAVRLVDMAFRLLNSIAAATDVSLLLPQGKSILDVRDGPPEDRTFQLKHRMRIDLLG